METTFITIHDLSAEARIVYSSDSIVDVLGHTPDEVVGKSTWEFFKPTDVPSAQKLHSRSITMDKASVLVYCDIRNRQGDWVRCECCFSIVYNVMVACTSIYREGLPGIHRRADAPIVRRLFSSSPQDPRYHMLQHLSTRFRQEANEQTNEPRAALFLNRFTRTLTIMYATSGIEHIIGISGEQMKGRSFYYCIGESCLEDAVKCLETAKGNDSIAYLRFLFRDPRQDDETSEDVSSAEDSTDAEMTDAGASESEAEFQSAVPEQAGGGQGAGSQVNTGQPSSGENIQHGSTGGSAGSSHLSTGASTASSTETSIELEAVVSCTSDGLVVCLRRARPAVPETIQNTVMPPQTAPHPYTGYYAAPWGLQPVYQPYAPTGFGPMAYPGMPSAYGGPPPMPPAPMGYHAAAGPNEQDFLRAIQECGVFAWDLVGINGSLADVARGEPGGRAAPPDGPTVWAPGHPSAESSSGRGTGTTNSAVGEDIARSDLSAR